MVNPAWGKKRVCTGCSVRFYDMRNPIPTCPKCGTTLDVHSLDRPKSKSVGVIMDALEDLSFTVEEDPTAEADRAVLEDDDDFDSSLTSITTEDEG